MKRKKTRAGTVTLASVRWVAALSELESGSVLFERPGGKSAALASITRQQAAQAEAQRARLAALLCDRGIDSQDWQDLPD